MEPLEKTTVPWAQGVGRSNRPAPTNFSLIPKELFDLRSIAFAVPLPCAHPGYFRYSPPGCSLPR